MPSTPSSAEQGPSKRPAAEVLSSRYKQLFLLPSSSSLLLYAALTSAALAFVSRGIGGAVTFLIAFIVFYLSSSAISSVLQLTDKQTIANHRRVSAVLLVGNTVWLVFVICGAALASLEHSAGPLNNSFVFGAFAASGFEFLVLAGALVRRASLAAVLAGIHPAASLMVLRYAELSTGFDAAVLPLAVFAYVVIVAFIFVLMRRKVSGGHDAVTLFQGFMKTWAGGNPTELEDILLSMSEETDIETKVMQFRAQAGNIILVLPGVHPGPFHPVGSYDLPGVISRTFGGRDAVLTLHRPGGHELNLPTRSETQGYATEIHDKSMSMKMSTAGATIGGPIRTKVGEANVGVFAFDEDALLTVSFAPLGSDDIDSEVEAKLTAQAATAGLKACVVDAHNSLRDHQETIDPSDPGWMEAFRLLELSDTSPFKVGYAHSKELGLTARDDLTENGVGLVMFQTPKAKSVLVLADANNAVPSLRAKVAEALDAKGYELIELCTSDSHNLAARGLTVSRGYNALGEVTPVGSLAELVVGLAQLAESRLSSCAYGSQVFISRLKTLGNHSLDELAGITQSTSRLAKNYSVFALVSVAILFAFVLAL